METILFFNIAFFLSFSHSLRGSLWGKLLYLQNAVTCFFSLSVAQLLLASSLSVAQWHNFWWSPSHRRGNHKSSLCQQTKQSIARVLNCPGVTICVRQHKDKVWQLKGKKYSNKQMIHTNKKAERSSWGISPWMFNLQTLETKFSVIRQIDTHTSTHTYGMQ